MHAPDCDEAPLGAPLLGVEQALDVAETPGTRLCALCGCARELAPMLSGCDHITDPRPAVPSMVTGTSSGTIPSLLLNIAVMLRRTGSSA